MSNPLARLLGQAELNLADLSRRAVSSVADPIKAKGQEVVADVVGAATGALKTLVIKAVLGIAAGLMLIVAIVYALGALYWYLLPRFGPVEARLILAGAFALVGVIAILAMAFWPKGQAARPATKTDGPTTTRKGSGFSSASQPTGPTDEADTATTKPSSMDFKGSVDALANILGEAGYRREQAGLKTGVALASQLKPMQIVALALIGGYVAGLRTTARRR